MTVMIRLDTLVEQKKDDMIKTLQRLVRIESTKSSPMPGAPFGPGVARALDEMLAICREMGFTAIDVDHYMGYTECGQGDETIGILVHLDVVPAEGSWMEPPFEAVVKNGKVYGRGTVDNKGPAVYSLYALSALRDAGIVLNKKVRLLFGCDEESGWADVDYYLTKDKMPQTGFSPDGAYPVINAEKGLVHIKLEKSYIENKDSKNRLISLHGGKRPNIVPGTATAVMELDNDQRNALEQLKNEKGIEVIWLPDGNTEVVVQGVPAHGSKPQLGVNAVSRLLKVVSALSLVGGAAEFCEAINQAVGLDWDGRGFGLQLSDEVSGELTLNLGMMHVEETKGEVVLDIRYPISFTQEHVVSAVQQTLSPFGIAGSVQYASASHFIAEDDPLVKTLLEVYAEKTEKKPFCVSVGGGTYARTMERGVAFGPVMPGEADLAHQENEYISVENMVLGAKMVAQAVCRLAAKPE
ncbi:MAG: dipeptidase PepV [Christensenellales bacterium]